MNQKISGIEKFYASEKSRGGGGVSRSPSKTFCHTVPKNFVGGTLRCFRKFRVSQNFMHKKRISLNSVENFLCHSAEKTRNFIHKRGEGGLLRFSVENLSQY